jgi:rare lipoprotein A
VVDVVEVVMGDGITPGRAGARPLGAAGAVLLLAVLAGCATQTLQPPTTQRGVASWYGPGFHGQATASGETYDQFEMTAAHRTWPLGTRVRVTNEENGRSCTVRINDRGPFVGDRILDLSFAAANQLGVVEGGTATVTLEPLSSNGRPPGVVAFAVQVAAFNDQERADAFKRRFGEIAELRGGSLRQPSENVYVATGGDRGRTVYRVRVGPYARRDEAQILASSLERRGIDGIVVEEVLASR